jgi:hypothetical protein
MPADTHLLTEVIIFNQYNTNRRDHTTLQRLTLPSV